MNVVNNNINIGNYVDLNNISLPYVFLAGISCLIIIIYVSIKCCNNRKPEVGSKVPTSSTRSIEFESSKSTEIDSSTDNQLDRKTNQRDLTKSTNSTKSINSKSTKITPGTLLFVGKVLEKLKLQES